VGMQPPFRTRTNGEMRFSILFYDSMHPGAIEGPPAREAVMDGPCEKHWLLANTSTRVPAVPITQEMSSAP
jgi:hypothetical protein